MDDRAARITLLRKARRQTQQQFADNLGVSRGAVANWERGLGIKYENLELISEKCGVPLEWIAKGEGEAPLAQVAMPPAKTKGFKPEIVPGSELVGAKDFPIYAAAAGGPGHVIVTFDAIEWVKRPAILEGVPHAYGLLVYGDSMSPAYRHGDMALIHPGLGPAADEDVVLYDHPPNGDAEAIIKHLVTWTEEEWRLEQYNPPKVWSELRADWQTCHRVVGKYGRRR